MQSSANVQLTPEEEVTMSVAANDLGDFVEGAVRVVREPCVTVSDSDEGVPFIPIQELTPGLF